MAAAINPLNILPVEEPEQQQQPEAAEVQPPVAEPPQPKRPRGKKKKRGRPKGRRNRPSPSLLPLASAPAATTTESILSNSSEPAAAERLAEFDRQAAAVPDVIGEQPAAPGAEGLLVDTPEGSELAAELAELGPDFHALAEEYVPKAFEFAAAVFESDHWLLSPKDGKKTATEKILMGEAEGCFQELYPEWQRLLGSWKMRYPKTLEFGLALSIPVIVRLLHQRKLWAAKRAAATQRPDPLAPASTVSAIATPASPASSGLSGSPAAASPTVWPQSSGTVGVPSSSTR